MHPYATDSTERKIVPFLIAVFAILATWAASDIMKHLHIDIAWWMPAPSALTFYAVFYAIFDHWVWRWPMLRWVRIVKVPDLRGHWGGRIHTSFDEHATVHEIEVKIMQTWTSLFIEMEGKDSMSHSLIAGVQVEDGPVPILSYQYLNEPLPHAVKTMSIHYGTSLLRLIKPNELDGQYYSGRDRQTFGSIELERQLGP